MGDDSEEQSIFLLNPSNYVLKKSDKNKADCSTQTKIDYLRMLNKFNIKKKDKSFQASVIREPGFDVSIQTVDFAEKDSRKVKKEKKAGSKQDNSDELINKLLILENFYDKMSKVYIISSIFRTYQ